jgi:hypothetical protein
MSFNFRYIATPSYYGGGDTNHTVQFQPVIPFKAWGRPNILRTTIGYDVDGPAGSGLTDVTIFDLLVFERPWGRFGVGPVMQILPERNGRDGKFAIGPAAGFVLSKDDSSRHDHATVMPRLGEGPVTGSVRPGSNICGAQC